MDVDRLRYVTERYPRLQGLRLLPIAAVFLTSAIWRAGWLPPHAIGDASATRWFLGGLSAAVGLSFVVRSWYTRTFGVVSQPLLKNGVVPLAALGVCFAITIGLQGQWGWRVSAPAIFLGMALFCIGLADHAVRRHHVAVAMVWFGFAGLTAFGASWFARDVGLDIAVGLGLVIAGIGDHLLLQRTLRAPTA